MKLINLTQHPATAPQKTAGVHDLPEEKAGQLRQLLTFEKVPTPAEIHQRAEDIARLAQGQEAAMIGGAPFLMGPLEQALRRLGVQPYYAFSKRETTEQRMPDGSVRKTSVFQHGGFVKAASALENPLFNDLLTAWEVLTRYENADAQDAMRDLGL